MKATLYVLDGRVINVGEWDLQLEPEYEVVPLLDEAGEQRLHQTSGEPLFHRVETGVILTRNPVPDGVVIIEDGEYLMTADEKIVLASDYVVLRKAEYPPVADYLDAIAKGDTVAIDAYCAACLAVKAKYPKPAAKARRRGK
jgi:hypothetical protein